MKENLQQSLRKIKILEDRVEQLLQLKKKDVAIIKAKKLFHLSTSFTVILLLNENFELFEELLGVALTSWQTLMKLHTHYSFNLYWKKQILAFELLALIHAQKRKYKTGLKAIYAAQTIVAELDEQNERNLDYIMAVNTLTGFLLMSIHKPAEALEFILIAERIVYKLIELNSAQAKLNIPTSQPGTTGDATPTRPLEVIGESGIEEQLISHRLEQSEAVITEHRREMKPRIFHQRKQSNRSNSKEEKKKNHTSSTKFAIVSPQLNHDSAIAFDDIPMEKKSCLSPTLLSNYVLAISLLKNIAMKHSQPDTFDESFEDYITQIKHIEKSLLSMGNIENVTNNNGMESALSGGDFPTEQEEEPEPLCNGVAVSFLIKQHKLEILENPHLDYVDMANETFNKEFMNMLQVCIFVPFLHVETPRPHNVQKVPPLKENTVPQEKLIRETLNYRLKIGVQQKYREAQNREIQRLQELSIVQDSLAENSISIGAGPSIDSIDEGKDGTSIDNTSPGGREHSREYPISFPIFDQAKLKEQKRMQATQQKVQQSTQNMRKKYNQRNRSLPGVPSRMFKGSAERMPKLLDAEKFSVVVDENHQTGKRKGCKLGQKRPSIFGAGASPAPSNSNIDDSNVYGNQSIDASIVDGSDSRAEEIIRGSKLKIKMTNLQMAVKRSSNVSISANMNNTMLNQTTGSIGFPKAGTVTGTGVNAATGQSFWPKAKKIEASKSIQPKLPQVKGPRMTMTAQQKSPKMTNVSVPRRFLGTTRRDAQSEYPYTTLPVKNTVADLIAQSQSDERYKQYQNQAKEHEENINRILAGNQNDWSSLYSHPKLMGKYFWKDDAIHTNKQRVREIKKVMQTRLAGTQVKGQLRSPNRWGSVANVSQSLLTPMDRSAMGPQPRQLM